MLVMYTIVPVVRSADIRGSWPNERRQSFRWVCPLIILIGLLGRSPVNAVPNQGQAAQSTGRFLTIEVTTQTQGTYVPVTSTVNESLRMSESNAATVELLKNRDRNLPLEESLSQGTEKSQTNHPVSH